MEIISSRRNADFIPSAAFKIGINYDIKYRMRRENEEGEN